MASNVQLLELLVCPQCKGKLNQVEGGRGLLCRACQLKFPVKEGIPVMLVEEALDMRGSQSGLQQKSTPITPKKPAPGGATQMMRHRALFRIVAGPDSGTKFELELGSCRALGRSVGDPTKTAVLSVDWALSLDEETKSLILQYISRQFQKPTPKPEEVTGGHQIGTFRRGPDIVFTDKSLSRLHAMIFFDEVGLGVLDLVSRNGTFVNGQEIESCLLKQGDTIELGETKVVLEG